MLLDRIYNKYTIIFLFCKKTEERHVEILVKKNDKIYAPIKVGDKIGEILVYENGVLIASANAVSSENVELKSYSNALGDVIDNWNI